MRVRETCCPGLPHHREPTTSCDPGVPETTARPKPPPPPPPGRVSVAPPKSPAAGVERSGLPEVSPAGLCRDSPENLVELSQEFISFSSCLGLACLSETMTV